MPKPPQHALFSSLNHTPSPSTLLLYSHIPDSIPSTYTTYRSQTFHFENLNFFPFLAFNRHTSLPYITTGTQHPSNIFFSSTFLSSKYPSSLPTPSPLLLFYTLLHLPHKHL